MPDRSFLAWPFFDDAHRALAAKLDAWTTREIEPLAHSEHDVDALSRRLVAMLGDAGWLRYAVPEEYGGLFKELDDDRSPPSPSPSPRAAPMFRRCV